MSADKRGFKRVCIECGNRFYDLNKRPIICPACSAEFAVEEKLKPLPPQKKDNKKETPKAEAETSKEAPETSDDELEEEDDGVEVVSLDDLETVETTDNDDDGEVKINLEDDSLDDIDVDLDAGPNPDDELDEEA